MALDIRQEQKGAVRILALGGRLDTETSADLELAVQDLLAAGDRHFIIDLTDIGYVSSAGLRVLLATAKQLDGGKGSMRLCGLNASVQQVFDVAGFSKLFAIYADRNAALDKHPQAKVDPQLARNVASLIGAGDAPATTNPQAADVARSAAQLLGAKPPGAAASAPAKAKLVTPPPPMKQRAAPSPQEKRKSGLMDKLRGLFGGK